MEMKMIKCAGCGIEVSDENWEEKFTVAGFENFSTGYDGDGDWYQETYKMQCDSCLHITDVTDGWIIENK